MNCAISNVCYPSSIGHELKAIKDGVVLYSTDGTSLRGHTKECQKLVVLGISQQNHTCTEMKWRLNYTLRN